jgi:hypothetical protein
MKSDGTLSCGCLSGQHSLTVATLHGNWVAIPQRRFPASLFSQQPGKLRFLRCFRVTTDQRPGLRSEWWAGPSNQVEGEG